MEEQPVHAAPPEAPAPPPPIIDVKAPSQQPAESPGASAPAPNTPAPKQPAKLNTPPKAPPKPKAKGVMAAIMATVIIVLGLAALAVYAYVKTK